MSIESDFNDFYDKQVWINGSGSGSDITNCRQYVDYLVAFLKENNIKSIVDVGCGDWQYMQHVNLDGIEYIGIDIVESVLETNRKLFNRQNVRFVKADCVDDDLPVADLLICKEVLQHLHNEEILAILPKFRKYKFCLVVNDYGSNLHRCWRVKRYAPLDLLESPFNIKGKTVLNWEVNGCFKAMVEINNCIRII